MEQFWRSSLRKTQRTNKDEFLKRAISVNRKSLQNLILALSSWRQQQLQTKACWENKNSISLCTNQKIQFSVSLQITYASKLTACFSSMLCQTRHLKMYRSDQSQQGIMYVHKYYSACKFHRAVPLLPVERKSESKWYSSVEFPSVRLRDQLFGSTVMVRSRLIRYSSVQFPSIRLRDLMTIRLDCYGMIKTRSLVFITAKNYLGVRLCHTILWSN
jgi:hypothetical protein